MDPERYFVTVTAPSRDRIKELATRGLDLFQPTARTTRKGSVIEGLMTLEEVAELVAEGYQVSIDGTMKSRARAVDETTSLDAWLQTMGE